ncbi:MAG: hypothetical protein Nk1A_2990 [Endomicrobiia bacterium]|nr:MAG: hypothetical protein Nk1A_2990 [Endomicrobiia bacterium]
MDLYHDKNGKLCGEIIRKIDFNKNKIPNYKNERYNLLEGIYQGNTLETDINENKHSLKNEGGPAPSGRTFVKVLIFTEIGKYFEGKKYQIRIFFSNILKSEHNQEDSFSISSMQNYNIRKVILTPLGFI